jgi:hypothetical protein
VCVVYLEHLPVSHLHRQEHHHERRKPDTTSSEPQDTRALRREKLRASIRCHDTGNATHAGQHAADTAAVAGVEKLRRGCVEHGVEILSIGEYEACGSVREILTVCMMYSSAFNPT